MTSPKTLSDARIQLHWAAQTLSAAADATLRKADDDSHSNLGWDSQRKAVTGRAGAFIDVVDFTLNHDDESFDLNGKSLGEAMAWLGLRVGKTLIAREYDMPSHPVSFGAENGPGNGKTFSPDRDQLKAIADWYTFGENAMADVGELRIWPHHFDLGFFKRQVIGDHSIGGGFTIGDEHYPFPYFYVNPYGANRLKKLPEMKTGFWTDKWLGAVITVDEFGDDGGSEVAKQFVKSSMANCLYLLSAVRG